MEKGQEICFIFEMGTTKRYVNRVVQKIPNYIFAVAILLIPAELFGIFEALIFLFRSDYVFLEY